MAKFTEFEGLLVDAVYACGDRMMNSWGKEGLVSETKADGSVVTEVDKENTRRIIDAVGSVRPDCSIITEEDGGYIVPGSDASVIIDGLDATSNYVHGRESFGVSISYAVGGEVVFSLFYQPIGEKLYRAKQGYGAVCNGGALRVSKQTTLKGALIGYGAFEDMGLVQSALARAGAGAINNGCITAEHMEVAAGSLDGVIYTGPGSWDSAGAWLFTTEAGGVVSNARGRQELITGRFCGGCISAATPELHAALVDVMREHWDKFGSA